ncbi:hypothetical protein R84B8_02071 [Treponema sp. R8-4-B8]
MSGGVLVLTRAVGHHAEIKKWLEALGFQNVTVTDKDNNALNTVICNKNPSLVIIDSWFYHICTAERIKKLLEVFPKLNIAVVSNHDFPVSYAPCFIWSGAKSYLDMWEDNNEFYRGLRIVREGGQYISPKVQEIIDHFDEYPDANSKVTKKERECLVMLCSGFTIEQIMEELDIAKSTVYNHLNSLYKTFHVHSREEMIALAWEMELVTPKDIRFYDGKKECLPIPKWAEVKKKCDKFYTD